MKKTPAGFSIKHQGGPGSGYFQVQKGHVEEVLGGVCWIRGGRLYCHPVALEEIP